MAWIRFQMNSQAINMPVSFDVLTPEQSDNTTEKKWKTLYLLHGFGGDRNEWLFKSRLRQIIKGRTVDGCPLMIVLPEGNNSFFVSLPNGHDYGEFLCTELTQFIGDNLPVSCGSEDRIIAGIETGGYAAVRQALAHPGVFGRAAAFDAPFDMHKYYQETPLPSSMVFNLEHVFGREEIFKGSENDLFALSDACLANAKTPKLLLVTSRGGLFGKDFTIFDGYAKKIGFPGVHTVSLQENDLDFYESALKSLLQCLEGGTL
jgi:S-formylglutathione hydrolase FrmB